MALSILRLDGSTLPDLSQAAAALDSASGLVVVVDPGAPRVWVAQALIGLFTPPPPPLFKESADTKKVYVSSTSGSDSNTGLSEDKPLRTILAGVAQLRHGYPDWLLLKRGDEWQEPLGRWKKSGRSWSEPMVVWAYGNGYRPLLNTGSQIALEIAPGGSTPSTIDHVSVSGIEFRAHTRNPAHPAHSTAGGPGIRIAHVCRNLLFDDLRVSWYTLGMSLEAWRPTIDSGVRLDGVTVRRCVITDSYNTGGHSQGIFASRCDRLLIEDSVLDHNGWGETSGAGDDPTIYNHALYLQATNGLDVVVQRNVICRPSSHGIQLRSGGVIRDNLFFRCPISIQIGSKEYPNPAAKFEILNNVVIEGTDITPEPNKAGGWGIHMDSPAAVALVEGNIVAHCLSTKGNRRSIEIHPWATYKDNIVYDWTSGPNYNVLPPSPGPFVDPSRRIPIQGLFERLRLVSRLAPDEAFSAGALCRYIREGFQPA